MVRLAAHAGRAHPDRGMAAMKIELAFVFGAVFGLLMGLAWGGMYHAMACARLLPGLPS